MEDTGKQSQTDVSTDAEQKKSLSLAKNILFGLMATVVFFGILEIGARLVGFKFRRTRLHIVAKGEVLDAIFQPIDEEWWEPARGRGHFNEAGFVGPLYSKERTPDTVRVAVLGDSCSEWGEPPYSGLLQEILSESHDKRIEVLNAAVAGYTTYQGRIRLKKQVLDYRPNAVSLYFGWNDHFMVKKLPDREVMTNQTTSWSSKMLRSLSGSRVVQIGFLLEDMFRVPPDAPELESVFRVSLDDYRENLREMVAMIRGVEAVPILITAPTNMTAETPVAGFYYVLRDLHTTDYKTPKQLHDDYVEATRQVGRETGAVLLDAAIDFEGQDHLISADHVHLTEPGMQRMAQLLAEVILEQFPPSR